MKTEIKAYPLYGANFKVLTHENEYPNFEARFAMSLVERWGLVMADVDGEDSQGRQKAKLMAVDDVVARACETAKVLVAALEERGWMVKGPSLEECEEIARKKDKELA